MAQPVDGVVDVFPDLKMSFSTASKLVVEGMGHFGQLRLRHKVMRNPAEMLDRAVIQAIPHPLADREAHQLLAQSHIIGQLFFQFPPLRISVGTIGGPLGLGVRLGLVQQIGNPSRDRLDQHLCAFPLKKVEHVEVAVALRNLRPELARDFHHWLHFRAIHFDRIEFLAGSGQGIEVVLAPEVFMHLAENIDGVAEDLVALKFGLCPVGRDLFNFERVTVPQIMAELVDYLPEYSVGLALIHLERANLVDHVVEHVTQVHGVQHAESEVDGELQSRLARGGLDSIAVLKQQHAEAIEAGVLEREAILRLIHAEAARTA